METLIERGCGLDVHKKSVAACVRLPGPKGTRQSHVRTCGTMAAELAALREWLESQGVTHVAMESTGVYWKPVWVVLEEAFTCLLVQRGPRQAGPGPQERHAGLCLDRPVAGARALAGELRAAGPDPGTPGSHPLPQAPHRRAHARGQPAA